jgi:hypothetical protein
MSKTGWKLVGIILAFVMISSSVISCSKSGSTTQTTTPSPGVGGGAIVQSDSIITAQVKAIRKQITGYPWEVDVLVQTSANVDTLPNPTSDKIGQVITTKSDEDMSSFKVGQAITAKVKYVGDVPKSGITLYLYNVKANILVQNRFPERIVEERLHEVVW